jgi:hypothetical protein
MMFADILTDPGKHTSSYLYLAHAICGDRKLQSRMYTLTTPGEFYSASLIGRIGAVEHTDTFTTYGLIVRPPESSIYVAWNCDLGTKDKKAEVAMKNRGRVMSPHILLRESVGHNEVLAEGNPLTKVEGVFCKSEYDLDTALAISGELGIPLVYLPEDIEHNKYNSQDLTKAFFKFRWPEGYNEF